MHGRELNFKISSLFGQSHKHEVSEALWKKYKESRRLDENQRREVLVLYKDKVPTAAVVARIRKSTGKSVSTKDVINALANLTELVFGERPSEIRFSGPKLRTHLRNCMHLGVISRFPKVGAKVVPPQPTSVVLRK